MRRTVPPSAEIQVEIDKLLGSGLVDDPQRMLSELARLGARLIIQRAVEEEFDTWQTPASGKCRAAGPSGSEGLRVPAFTKRRGAWRDRHGDGRAAAGEMHGCG